MTKNRNLKHRIRLRASKTGESYAGARRHVVSAGPSSMFEDRRPSDYLLRAASSAAGQAYKSLAIEQLEIRAHNTVLDLGCGTGGELEPLLGTLGPDGTLIGLDTDTDALRVASQRFDDPRLRLLTGDAHSLDLVSGSIDRVYVDRTAQHFSVPETVLEEIRRILRPGGRIVLAEPDWQSPRRIPSMSAAASSTPGERRQPKTLGSAESQPRRQRADGAALPRPTNRHHPRRTRLRAPSLAVKHLSHGHILERADRHVLGERRRSGAGARAVRDAGARRGAATGRR
jgi:SAM-dependent methyltransferase